MIKGSQGESSNIAVQIRKMYDGAMDNVKCIKEFIGGSGMIKDIFTGEYNMYNTGTRRIYCLVICEYGGVGFYGRHYFGGSGLKIPGDFDSITNSCRRSWSGVFVDYKTQYHGGYRSIIKKRMYLCMD